jgi:hypothetical protein
MRMDVDQSTVIQPYTQRNLFENEKTPIDRMVTRRKQLLEHVRPWEPDDKEYVPFDKFHGYDDILYDVVYTKAFSRSCGTMPSRQGTRLISAESCTPSY